MTQDFKLNEVANVFNGKTPSKADQRTSGYPVLKIKDVNEYGFFVGGFTSFVDNDLAKKHKQKIIKQDDILILNAAHNADYVGSKIYQATAEATSSLATGEWLIVRATSENIDPKYLFYWVISEKTKQKLKNLVKGIHLYPKDVSDLSITLPSLSEQRRIAAVLDKADAIRRKRQRAIALTEEFLRSAFLEMFGDPETNPQNWQKKQLHELLAESKNSIRTGPFGSQLKHSEFITEGVPVLGIDNIVTNKFRWTEPRCLPPSKYANFKRYRIYPDDVVVTIMGTTGRVAVMPPDLPECMSTKHLCVISLSQKLVDPVFIWATLMFDETVRGQAKTAGGGAIMEGWNLTIIKDLTVRVPPLSLQHKFRKKIEKVREIQATHNVYLENSQHLFNSLTHRAFSGQLSLDVTDELLHEAAAG